MRTSIRLILLLPLCLISLACCSKQDRPAPVVREEDPSRDPLYASYRFGGEGSIDFGVQPLTMPESSISELVCRDRTLAARLGRTGQTLKPFPFSKGKDAYYFMTRGSLEAGVLGDMPAITAAARGDIVIVAMLKQGFSTIVAARPMLVKDLKGKRVATGLGSTSHFSLLSALEEEGLTEADVTLVGMDVGDMPQALADGRIDAFSAWEPTPTLAFTAHPEFHLVHRGLSFGFLCLRRDFLASHPAESLELVAAVARSGLWMRQPGNLDRVATWTRSAAARFQGREFPMEALRLIGIIRRDLLNIPVAPRIPERLLLAHELLWQEFEFLKKTGKIPQTTTWETIRGAFDTGLLRRVFAEPGRYALERYDYRSDLEPGGAK